MSTRRCALVTRPYRNDMQQVIVKLSKTVYQALPHWQYLFSFGSYIFLARYWPIGLYASIYETRLPGSFRADS